MSDFLLVKFKDTNIQFIDGDRGTNYPKKNEMLNTGFCVFLDTSNVSCNGFNFDKVTFITAEKDNKLRKGKIKQDDIVITTRGTLGNVAYFNENIPYKNIRINSGMVIIRVDLNEYLPYYIYVFFRSSIFKNQLSNYSSGSSQPQLPICALKNISVPKIDINTQKKIIKIITTLDKKIELNNRINAELEAMAKTLYDYWFVQFDFPDANGKPYKSSGGKMVYNETLKREIPEGWGDKKLESVIEIHDSKRVPLSSKERSSMKGDIPYHGATSIMDYINDYIFNGEYVLLAEDGSVMNAEGMPVLQYIWGKSWVNNHAHVLTGKNGFSNELLHLTLSKIPVINMMSGSIQKKINQENLKKTPILYPTIDVIKLFQPVVNLIYRAKIKNIEQINKLKTIRDWLLPMLMNGQVKVK